MQVKLSRCEVEDTLQGCITFSQLPSLLPLLRHSIQLAKLGNHTVTSPSSPSSMHYPPSPVRGPSASGGHLDTGTDPQGTAGSRGGVSLHYPMYRYHAWSCHTRDLSPERQ